MLFVDGGRARGRHNMLRSGAAVMGAAHLMKQPGKLVVQRCDRLVFFRHEDVVVVDVCLLEDGVALLPEFCAEVAQQNVPEVCVGLWDTASGDRGNVNQPCTTAWYHGNAGQGKGLHWPRVGSTSCAPGFSSQKLRNLP